MSARSFWLPSDAAQFDDETLRDHLLEQGTLRGGLALPGSPAGPGRVDRLASRRATIHPRDHRRRPTAVEPASGHTTRRAAVCYQFLLYAA
jgi:hypothetical protein